MQDLEDAGIDPMTHLALTKALTQLYLGIIGDTNADNHLYTDPPLAGT